MRDAMDFSTGEKNVMALYEKRAAAEEEAAKKAADRQANATLDSEIEAYERAQAEKQRLEEEAKREEEEKRRKDEQDRQSLLRDAAAVQKELDRMGNQPGKTGAVSAQEGSVEAYKLLLQRDNEQKQIAEEAKQQTILQQRMADLLEQANAMPKVTLSRAR
jgi:colicin import membrane protein